MPRHQAAAVVRQQEEEARSTVAGSLRPRAPPRGVSHTARRGADVWRPAQLSDTQCATQAAVRSGALDWTRNRPRIQEGRLGATWKLTAPPCLSPRLILSTVSRAMRRARRSPAVWNRSEVVYQIRISSSGHRPRCLADHTGRARSTVCMPTDTRLLSSRRRRREAGERVAEAYGVSHRRAGPAGVAEHSDRVCVRRRRCRTSGGGDRECGENSFATAATLAHAQSSASPIRTPVDGALPCGRRVTSRGWRSAGCVSVLFSGTGPTRRLARAHVRCSCLHGRAVRVTDRHARCQAAGVVHRAAGSLVRLESPRPSSSDARPLPHVLRPPCLQAGATGAREQATTATPAPAAAAAAAPPPPPPPPDVVTVTVDGKQVSVPRNISVLQVCSLPPRRVRGPREPRHGAGGGAALP
jgi:hypothetical protein